MTIPLSFVHFFLCLIFFYCVLWLFPFCLFLESCLFILFIMRLVSWCSWLSHHFYVVRVPGSNPGGTIYCSPSLTCSDQYRAAMLINFSKKQRREVSINRPASYEPAALPLRYPAFTSHVLCFFAPPFFIFFPFCFFYEDEYKIPSPGIEPGAQT